uniref:Uncharacterized protein n=1 Tax=Cyclophora tenuis TaxID=216820 RepID=A0A7S1D2X3_CYCTE|mmetsp:Transcript_17791/g.30223  ORF Transcript_17791/g.30223 Transcript_17791/m.30223 type:complete len:219 (+) Transcript_17791:158-814(+)
MGHWDQQKIAVYGHSEMRPMEWHLLFATSLFSQYQEMKRTGTTGVATETTGVVELRLRKLDYNEIYWPPKDKEGYYVERFYWHGPRYAISNDKDKRDIVEGLMLALEAAPASPDSPKGQKLYPIETTWMLISKQEAAARIVAVLEEAAAEAKAEGRDRYIPPPAEGDLPFEVLSDPYKLAKALESYMTTEESRQALRDLAEGKFPITCTERVDNDDGK